MSFWNTSTGESAITESKSFEIEGGGNLDPIPDGSHVLAMINTAKWETVKNGVEEFINIKWEILKPAAYENRKVFQKLWVDELDPGVKDKEKAIAKKDKALRMFSTIDLNAGGRLSKLKGRPDDDDLAAALSGKMMVIGLRVWETKNAAGDDASGNWVYFIGDKSSELKEGVAKAKKKTMREEMGESDLPF